MWGNINFDFVASSARGCLGGVLSIWDPLYFAKSRVICTDNLVIVHGKWVYSDTPCTMINVYAPATDC